MERGQECFRKGLKNIAFLRIQIELIANCFAEGELSPLVNEKDGGFMKVDDNAEKRQIENVQKWKSRRNNKKVNSSLSKLHSFCISSKTTSLSKIKLTSEMYLRVSIFFAIQ